MHQICFRFMAFIAETCMFIPSFCSISSPFISSIMKIVEKIETAHKWKIHFPAWRKQQFKSYSFSGVKVFELSLSSVTYKHRCVLCACMHASVHMCTFCYIVLVCFPSLTHAIHYLLSFTHLHTHEIDCRWRFDLLRALKCLPHTCVCMCACACILLSKSTFVTEPFGKHERCEPSERTHIRWCTHADINTHGSREREWV